VYKSESEVLTSSGRGYKGVVGAVQRGLLCLAAMKVL
jgi:hypothetical protein